MKLAKWVVLGCVAIGGPAFAAATTQPSIPPETAFVDGRDALYRGDYDKAIDLLRKAVAAEKDRTSYKLHLAKALHYAGKMDESQGLLAEILKTAPDHVEAGQMLAELHALRQDWKQIVEILEPLLKYRHDYPMYHLLAEAKYNLGQRDAARTYYQEAIKLNPASAPDHYQLGNLYLGQNAFALAADSYQNAQRLGLSSPVLHYKLGSAYFNLRNYFGKIATITVKSGKAGSISGDWYLIEPVPGHKDLFRAAPSNTAIYQIAKAIADGIEDRPEIRFLRANIYLNAGRHEQAHAMYSEIRQLIPREDQALFHYYFAQAAFGIGNYEQYLSLLQEAIKLDPEAYRPTLVEAYLKVAEQHNQRGEPGKYTDYLTRAVNESPQTAVLHLKLGNAYEEAGKLPEAIVQWRMVLDLEPDHPQRLELLNRIGGNK